MRGCLQCQSGVTAIECAFVAAFIALAAMGMLGGLTKGIVTSLISLGPEKSSDMP